MREGAEPLPVAVGQALALRTAMESGISTQAARSIDLVTEMVYDFDGFPFYHLTIAGTGLSNFWNAVERSDSRQQYWIAATGATKVRHILSYQADSSEMLHMLRTTVTAMGNKQPRRLVAENMTILFLEDNRGRLWLLGSREPSQDVMVDRSRKQYAEAVKRNNSPDFARKLTADWDALLEERKDAPGPRPSAQATNFLTAGFVQADGTLNVEKALAGIGAQTSALVQVDDPSKVSLQYNQEMYACEGWWIFCTNVYSKKVLLPDQQAHINNAPNDGERWTRFNNVSPNYNTLVGNVQRADSDFNRNPDEFRLDDWFPTGQIFNRTFLGCGPASVIRLLTWQWIFGGGNYTIPGGSTITGYNTGLGRPNWYGLDYSVDFPRSTGFNGFLVQRNLEIAHRMTAPANTCSYCGFPSQVNFQSPEIAVLTGTKYFAGGGLTDPSGVANGANAWLSARGSSWRARSSMFAVLSNLGWAVPFIGWVAWTQFTWHTADIVRSAMGSRNIPIVFAHAIPNTGGFGGHYQPSMQYKIYTRAENAIVLVQLEADKSFLKADGSTVNVAPGMYSITDSNLSYGGAYAIY